MSVPEGKETAEVTRYRVSGMDCASCAAKIESAAKRVPGVREVKVSIASGVMTLRTEAASDPRPAVERKVTDLGYRLAREGGAKAEVANDDDDDDRVPDLSQATSAYRRTLWIVVLLNLGYGAVEIFAGFFADSQALKADALDFVGDGAISLLGLLAIGWGLAARAKAALLQGVFLALLGIGVLGATLYRFIVLGEPAAEMMGVFGAIALVVNVLAAVLLLPHRAGDANVRAVWLFSRNDAIGNFAVVVAAGLVAWTGTPWPDLVVAVVIAGLFLHAAWTIIRHARSDLREAAEAREET